MRVLLCAFLGLSGLILSRPVAAETLLVMMDSGPYDEQRMKIVAEHIEAGGLTVQVASASLEDSALLLGCEAEEVSCLQQIASAGSADSILILPGSAGPFVALRNQERRSEPYPMARDNEAGWLGAISSVLEIEAAEEPAGSLDDLPVESPAELAGEDTGTSAASVGTGGPDASTEQELGKGAATFSLSRVRQRSWIVLGSGAAAAGLGLVFLSAASSKQDEVDGHATATAADFDALRELESSGKNFTVAGNIFLVGGTLAILGGVGLAVMDNKKPREPLGATVYPAVSGDQISIYLRWGAQ